VIFLDEIGEMPQTMQPKLLRVLQDGEIMAVGSTRPERVDVRVLSASNRDLKAAADSGTFRADLYYRLAAFPIALPPLCAATATSHERAVAMTPPGEIIRPERLSEKIRSGSNPAPALGPASSRGPSSENGNLRFARAEFEARHIAQVLASNQGNVSRSAKVLGISRVSLQRKMKEYNIR
jgi:transcriptional regulator with PAS, ATPase and Fis domain